MTHDDPEPKVRWGIMVGVSVVIHILVLGGAGFFAVGSSPHRTLYAPSMSVSLMGPGDPGLLPGPRQGGGPPASLPPPPKPKVEEKKAPPKPEPKPEPKAKAEKPKPTKPEVKAEKPKKKPKPAEKEKVVKVPKKAKSKKPKVPPPEEAPKKTAKKQQIPKESPKPPAKKPQDKSLSTEESETLAEIRKRLEDSKTLDSIRKRLLARANQTGTGGGGGGGGPAGQGSDSYKNEIARIFYSAWVLPRDVDIDDLETVIVIHISRSGKIIKTDVEKSSGDLYFDESVLRAIGKVKTGGGLPPLPPEIPGQVLVQGLLFDPKIQQGLSR